MVSPIIVNMAFPPDLRSRVTMLPLLYVPSTFDPQPTTAIAAIPTAIITMFENATCLMSPSFFVIFYQSTNPSMNIGHRTDRRHDALPEREIGGKLHDAAGNETLLGLR